MQCYSGFNHLAVSDDRRCRLCLLFSAGFSNHFNALILEDVLVNLHKYILPSCYVITCIRLFFTKHYCRLLVADRFREHTACHTVQKNREPMTTLFPRSPYTDLHAGVYAESTASSWFSPKTRDQLWKGGSQYRQDEDIYQLMDLGRLKGPSRAQLQDLGKSGWL